MTTEDQTTEDPIEHYRREMQAKIDQLRPTPTRRRLNDAAELAGGLAIAIVVSVGFVAVTGALVFAVVFAARLAWALGSAVMS